MTSIMDLYVVTWNQVWQIRTQSLTERERKRERERERDLEEIERPMAL